MERLNYSRLLRITNTEKPYRGRDTVDYPLLDRKYGYAYFQPRDENGETVFDIVFHNTYERVDIVSDEHERELKAQKHTIHTDIGETVDGVEQPSIKYYYRNIPNILGVVRPDNTFQFTTKYLSQSTTMFLNKMFSYTRWYMCRSSRHGGMVIKSCTTDSLHPVFKGMRIDTTTLQPHESSRYEVNGYRVNRGAAKKFMVRYEHMFKVCDVMTKTMDQESFYRTVLEIFIDAHPPVKAKLEEVYGYVGLSDENRAMLRAKAESLVESAPLDAFILYGVSSAYSTPISPYILRGVYRRLFLNPNSNTYVNMTDPQYVFDSLRKRFSTDMYKTHPGLMNVERYESGKVYPASQWGVSVLVNNQEVEQY